MPRYSVRYLLLETSAFALLFAIWCWMGVWYSDGLLVLGICALFVFGLIALYGLAGPSNMQVGAIVGLVIATAIGLFSLVYGPTQFLFAVGLIR